MYCAYEIKDVSVYLANESSVEPQTHHHGPSIHDKHSITVHHSVKSMSYCQHCAVDKFLSYGLLYQSISPTNKRISQSQVPLSVEQ